MVHARQRLYDVNHSGFIKSVVSGELNRPGNAAEEREIEDEFKSVFASYTGIDDVIPLSRGRLGAYFGIKNAVTPTRNKVLMSAFTIFDLINMVLVAGGVPEFVDVQMGSAHLSPSAIEGAIDERTAAVIVTHYHSSNRHIEEISRICRSKGVMLLEDCAISLGSRLHDRHVGTFGDFALFSFGLFKFVSTYFGGAMLVRDPEIQARIERELKDWPRMSASEMLPYFRKGLKLSALMQPKVFDRLTFPLFRLGYLRDIDFIKRNAQNDPDPLRRTELPEDFKRRPSLFQLREFIRQIPAVEQARQERLANATRYYEAFSRSNTGGLPERPDFATDSYLNFPLIVGTDREQFVREMMKSNYDLAVYYYRNCAEIEAFEEFHRYLPNLSDFVSKMVFFPTYPGVRPDYIEGLAKRACELLR